MSKYKSLEHSIKDLLLEKLHDPQPEEEGVFATSPRKSPKFETEADEQRAKSDTAVRKGREPLVARPEDDRGDSIIRRQDSDSSERPHHQQFVRKIDVGEDTIMTKLPLHLLEVVHKSLDKKIDDGVTNINEGKIKTAAMLAGGLYGFATGAGGEATEKAADLMVGQKPSVVAQQKREKGSKNDASIWQRLVAEPAADTQHYVNKQIVKGVLDAGIGATAALGATNAAGAAVGAGTKYVSGLIKRGAQTAFDKAVGVIKGKKQDISTPGASQPDINKWPGTKNSELPRRTTPRPKIQKENIIMTKLPLHLLEVVHKSLNETEPDDAMKQHMSMHHPSLADKIGEIVNTLPPHEKGRPVPGKAEEIEARKRAEKEADLIIGDQGQRRELPIPKKIR